MTAATPPPLAGLIESDPGDHKGNGHAPGTEPADDSRLMLRFAGGDEEAFVTLYRTYRDRMVSFCRRMLGNDAQAEDAAQEVFLKLYRVRARYEPRSRFSTFLYRIATNHCLNIRARAENRLTARDAPIETRRDQRVGDATDAIARAELRRALNIALAELPDNQRATLVLCHYEGLSYKEVAETISVSESAVKSLMHRARATLMQRLASLDPGAHAGEPTTQEVTHAV